MLAAGMGVCELDETTIERVVLSLMRFGLDAREELRALAPPRGPAEVEAALGLEAATRETLRAALIYNDYAAVRNPVAEALRRLGVVTPDDGAAWRIVARRTARALIEVSDENVRREQGVYAASVGPLAERRSPKTTTAPGPPSPIVARPSAAPADPSRPLSSRLQLFHLRVPCGRSGPPPPRRRRTQPRTEPASRRARHAAHR